MVNFMKSLSPQKDFINLRIRKTEKQQTLYNQYNIMFPKYDVHIKKSFKQNKSILIEKIE